MAPFRRGRSSAPSPPNAALDHDDEDLSQQKRTAAWEARRRRRSKTSTTSHQNAGTAVSRRSSSSSRHKTLPKDEYDPYDSDPGESYREHCDRIKGERSKSCLAMPRFLKESTANGGTLGFLNGIKGASVANAHLAGASSSKKQSLLDTSADTSTDISEPDDGSPRSMIVSRMIAKDEPAHDYPNGMPASLPRDLARVRYSLRTSIGDGSQQQPAMASSHLMERHELRPNNVHINISHWSDFGGRNYMEDRYVIEDMGAVQVEVSPVALRSQSNREAGVEVTFGQQQQRQQQLKLNAQRKNRRLKMPLTWLGVFDGHGGDKASQFCADWLSSYVRNEESYPFDLGFAMKNAFSAIDEDFVATGHPDGSTACAATLVGGRRVVCANAGDSRAIVVRRDGSIVRLSRDHKPGMPDETRRISELGGRVIYWGRWRVEGLLAVSRSVGDASLKPYVTAEPEVCEYDIGKDDWFLIMSSDGVWDVMDNEEAAHVVIASSCVMEEGQLKIDTDRFKWAARNLCEHAKSCGSTDNFSVIVVDLKSCGNPEAKSGRYSP